MELGEGVKGERDYHPGPEKARIRPGLSEPGEKSSAERPMPDSGAVAFERGKQPTCGEPAGRKPGLPSAPSLTCPVSSPHWSNPARSPNAWRSPEVILTGQLPGPRKEQREDLEGQTGRDPVKWISQQHSTNSGWQVFSAVTHTAKILSVFCYILILVLDHNISYVSYFPVLYAIIKNFRNWSVK